MSYSAKQATNNWEYIKLACSGSFIMESQGDGHYELLVKDSVYVTPNVLDRTVNGVKVYSTNDLFVKHPAIDGLWRNYGRRDDRR